ncbi:MAG: hypothetical protein Q4G58_16630 [bacterium]|nr:hypothetical protein [bacterium]
MKKGIAVLIMSCLVLAGCGGSSNESTSDELVLESNQQIKYGQVKNINGNELTVAWANQVSSSDMSSMKGGKRQNSTTDTATSDNANAATGSSDDKSGNAQGNTGGNSQGSTQEGATQGGAASSGNMDGGTPPNGDSQGGNAPNGDMGGGTPPDMNGGVSGDTSSNTSGDKGTTQSAGGSSSSSDKSNTNKGNSTNSSKQQNRTMYQLTGEEDTITIPVGTKVTTSLGATTTFSRIAASDTLKLLMQTNDAGEQVVVGVWIVA